MPVGQNYDAVLNIGTQVDSRQLYNQIANISSRIPPLRLKTQGFQALGSISRDANEFQRSLASSNARVIAFGISAGALFSVARAFREITKATIETQKSLADINVVLQLGNSELTKFSSELFDAANLTGQSFKTASQAALEFSRQGLSVQETLKRTTDALTLTRFSGLDVASSVASITATLNSFNDATLDSTKLINKLITVDQSFAVSARDLAEGFERVGSTAIDTGVDINSLIGLITAAKQTTGRDGPVIGNALKTIFQRIQRPEVIDTFRQFNIVVEDAKGEILSADRLLQNLAQAYKTADTQQRNFIVSLAAGVFQSNQFRALLADLGKANSVYAQSAKVAENATDAAAQRQTELNKTLSASINQLLNNLTQVAAGIGNLTIKPPIEKLTGYFTQLVEGAKGDNIGIKAGLEIGEGILRGIGNYLSGPGIVAIGALGLRLFANFAGFAAKSFANILEVTRGEYATRQAIQGLLANQPQLLAQINRGALSQVEIQQAILNSLRAQSVELARQGQIVAATKSLINTGVLKVGGGGGLTLGQQGIGLKQPTLRATKAAGYIPEIEEKLGAYAGGYTPGQVKTTNIPKLGQVFYNTAETIKKFPQFEQPAILPPQNSKAGLNYRRSFEKSHGFNPYANEGLVPNYVFEQIGKFRQPQQDKLKLAQEQLQKSGLYLKDYNIPISYLGRNPKHTGGYYSFANPFRTKPNINIYSGALVSTYSHEYGHFIDNLMGILQGGGKLNPSEVYSGFSRKSYFSEFNRKKLEQLFKRKYTDKYPDNPLEDFADAFAHIVPSGRVLTTGTTFERGYDFIHNNLQQFFKQYNSGKFGSFSDILKKFKSQTKIISPSYNNKIQTAVHTGEDFDVPSFPTYFSSGLIPSFASFDTNLLKRITQDYGIFGKKLDLKTRNNAQIRAAFGVSEKTGIPVDKILGDKYFQDEFRKFVPNYALSFGSLKSLVKRFKQSDISNRIGRQGESASAYVVGVGSGNINIPKGTSGEIIAHEIGHIFSDVNASTPRLLKERVANNTALRLLAQKGNLQDFNTYRQFAAEQIKNYKISEIKDRISALRPELIGSDRTFLTDNIVESTSVRNTEDILKLNKQKSANLRSLIREIGIKDTSQYIKSFIKKDFNYINELGARGFNKGLIPSFALYSTLKSLPPQVLQQLEALQGRKLPLNFTKHAQREFAADSLKYGRGSMGVPVRIFEIETDDLNGKIKKIVQEVLPDPNSFADRKHIYVVNPQDFGVKTFYSRPKGQSQIVDENRYKYVNAAEGFLPSLPPRGGFIKGFSPPISKKDLGKFVVIYKDEQSLVKGTRLYDKESEAEELVKLINDKNVVVRQLMLGVNSPKFGFSGLIPNFNALASAIKRENKAGIPLPQIRIGQSPILKAPANPLGLGVYNTRDEPLGLNQGIQRVASMGLDPKRAGTYAKGHVPNFAPQYFQNVPETIKDPFGRGPGTALLNPQRTQELEQEIVKLKSQIKIGTFNQQDLNNKIQDLGKTYNLTDDSLKQVGRRLQGSLRFFQQSTGLPGGRLATPPLRIQPKPPIERLETPFSKGSAIQVVQSQQQALRENQQRIKQEAINNDVYKKALAKENSYFNRRLERINTRLVGENLGIGRSTPQDIQRRSILQKRLAENRARISSITNTQTAAQRLQALESSASSKGGFGFLFGQGKRDFQTLRDTDPDRARAIQSSAQNRAFLASIVGPILGGVAQEAIGDRTRGQRGAGAIAGGLGNVAGFAATGFALGGLPGAAIGGVGGLLLELPKIFKAFSDTLPDLQRRLDELKNTSQQTSASLSGYIDTSEKLNQIYQGLVSGLTKGQIKQLETEQQKLLLSIPDEKIRKQAESLISSGNLSGARELQGLTGQIQQQNQNAVTLLASILELSKNIKTLSEIESGAGTRELQLGGNLFDASIAGTRAVIDARRNPIRREQLAGLASQVESQVAGLISARLAERQKNFLEVLAEPKNIEALNKVPKGNLDELGKIIEQIGLASDVQINPETLDKIRKIFIELDKFDVELGARFKQLFSTEGITNRLSLNEKIESNAQKSAKTLFALNKALFESALAFEKLGTSIEISGIQRLGQLTGDLRGQEIRQSGQNQIELLRRGGENLRNLFDFRQTTLGASNQARISREQLGINTGRTLFESLGGLRTGISDAIQKNLEKSFGESEPEKIEQQINKSLGQFDKAFQPFINRLRDGELVTFQFIRSLESAVAAELERVEAVKFGTKPEDEGRVAAETTINSLNKFSEEVIKLGRSFTVNRAQINTEQDIANRTAFEQFQTRRNIAGETFRQNQLLNERLSNIDINTITRQANLARQQLLVRPTEQIELRRQSNLTQTGGQLLSGAIERNREIGTLGLNIGNLETEVPKLIDNITKGIENGKNQLRELIELRNIAEESGLQGELQRRITETGGEEAITKELELQQDALDTLTELQNKYNLEKQKGLEISRQEIEDLKSQLAFASDRLNVERKYNEENARSGRFQNVRENLGNTVFSGLDFGANDFWNQMATNAADFGVDLKEAFKQGFAEAATGASSFNEALRNIGLTISKNILAKASNLATDTIFGLISQGGRSLFNIQGQNLGGPIKRYARGGFVNMGSGTKDDVPALLSGGEFVINKRSTSRLGKSNLEILNEKPERITDVIQAANSNEFNATFANEFFGVGSKTRPSRGELNVSKYLSDIGLTDEDNPQNILRFARERYFVDLRQYQKEIKKARSQFEKQQLTALYMAYINAGINVGGSYLSSRGLTQGQQAAFNAGQGPVSNSAAQAAGFGGNFTTEDVTNSIFGFNRRSFLRNMGGYIPNIKRYNFGGNVFGGDTIKDNIPAMLMGGEFVFNKQASSKLGLNRLNFMNKTGKIPGYADGGKVGDDFISFQGYNNYDNTDLTRHLTELNNIARQIRDNTGGNTTTSNNSGAININNSITVNVSENGRITTSTNTQVENKGNEKVDNRENAKQIGTLVQNIVTQELVKHSRNGGLLYERFKTK